MEINLFEGDVFMSRAARIKNPEAIYHVMAVCPEVSISSL
jgi:hypothetical protein